MEFIVTFAMTIDATDAEAARLWALDVQRHMTDTQPAITLMAEAEVELSEPEPVKDLDGAYYHAPEEDK